MEPLTAADIQAKGRVKTAVAERIATFINELNTGKHIAEIAQGLGVEYDTALAYYRYAKNNFPQLVPVRVPMHLSPWKHMKGAEARWGKKEEEDR